MEKIIVSWIIAFFSFRVAGWTLDFLPAGHFGETGFVATYLTLLVLLPCIGVSYFFYLRKQSKFNRQEVKVYFLIIFFLNSLLLIGCFGARLSVKWFYPSGFTVVVTLSYYYLNSLFRGESNGTY